MSNETAILIRSEEVRPPAAAGVEAAAKYLNSHPPAVARRGGTLVRQNPEQSIILALTVGFALGWVAGEALFPASSAK